MKRKILIFGGSGFVGKNLVNKIIKKKNYQVIYPNKKRVDLLEYKSIIKFLNNYKEIDHIIHAAGLVGGLYANQKFPADFCRSNLLQGVNLLEAAKNQKIKNIILLMGSCSYPNNAKNPIKEEYLWNGYPQESSAPYALAKAVISELGFSYNRQYKMNVKVLIPGNIYGPYDNFSHENSHVVPALIRKFHEHLINKKKEITIFGSGRAIRDFVYIEDLVDIIIKTLNKNIQSPVNVSPGLNTSIKDLALSINQITGANLKINWDKSKSDGQLLKRLDNKKLKKIYGTKKFTPLNEGLKRTYDWYLKNIENLRT